MKQLNEEGLCSKRKELLYALKEDNWNIVEINDDNSDWAYNEKWIIESQKENYGFKIELWFFKYDGIEDGMNNVIATNINSEQPKPYLDGDILINFNGRKFSLQLINFIKNINKLKLWKLN